MREFAPTYRLVSVLFRGEEGQTLYKPEIFKGRFREMLKGGIRIQVQGMNLLHLDMEASNNCLAFRR